VLKKELLDQRKILLNEVHLARNRYHAGQDNLEEYAQALQNFGDFILQWKSPEQRALTAASANAQSSPLRLCIASVHYPSFRRPNS
jgi:hypothetical protein